MRRFFARPASLALSATGSSAPKPRAVSRTSGRSSARSAVEHRLGARLAQARGSPSAEPCESVWPPISKSAPGQPRSTSAIAAITPWLSGHDVGRAGGELDRARVEDGADLVGADLRPRPRRLGRRGGRLGVVGDVRPPRAVAELGGEHAPRPCASSSGSRPQPSSATCSGVTSSRACLERRQRLDAGQHPPRPALGQRRVDRRCASRDPVVAEERRGVAQDRLLRGGVRDRARRGAPAVLAQRGVEARRRRRGAPAASAAARRHHRRQREDVGQRGVERARRPRPSFVRRRAVGRRVSSAAMSLRVKRAAAELRAARRARAPPPPAQSGDGAPSPTRQSAARRGPRPAPRRGSRAAASGLSALQASSRARAVRAALKSKAKGAITGRGAEMSSVERHPARAPPARSRASSVARSASLSATATTRTRPGATLILARGSSASTESPKPSASVPAVGRRLGGDLEHVGDVLAEPAGAERRADHVAPAGLAAPARSARRRPRCAGARARRAAAAAARRRRRVVASSMRAGSTTWRAISSAPEPAASRRAPRRSASPPARRPRRWPSPGRRRRAPSSSLLGGARLVPGRRPPRASLPGPDAGAGEARRRQRGLRAGA